MRHRDMRDAALAEERAGTVEGAVDELVDQHEGAGRQLLLERAAGRQRHQVGDARALEHVDIGPVVDVGRRQPMTLVVPRQKDHRQAGDLADKERRRRLAPWALDRLAPYFFEPRQVVDAGAADDAENRFGHFPSLVMAGLVPAIVPPDSRARPATMHAAPEPASARGFAILTLRVSLQLAPCQ